MCCIRDCDISSTPFRTIARMQTRMQAQKETSQDEMLTLAFTGQQDIRYSFHNLLWFLNFLYWVCIVPLQQYGIVLRKNTEQDVRNRTWENLKLSFIMDACSHNPMACKRCTASWEAKGVPMASLFQGSQDLYPSGNNQKSLAQIDCRVPCSARSLGLQEQSSCTPTQRKVSESLLLIENSCLGLNCLFCFVLK